MGPPPIVALAVAASLIATGASAPVRAAAPATEPWSAFAAFAPAARRVVDHRRWQDFLDRYLSRIADAPNRLRYGDVSASDRRRLGDYVLALAREPVGTLNRAEQRAYWINLYNALTVKVVLDHYPVASIRDIDISPGLFTRGPWGRKLVRIEGHEVSLDDIEHRILRPMWRDPRLHYALNCAALGCPELQAQAFTADNTERLLDRAAAGFIASSGGLRFTEDGLMVSRLFRWYADDFGGWPDGVLDHLAVHAPPALAARIRGMRIAGTDYDWSLNDARTPVRAGR